MCAVGCGKVNVDQELPGEMCREQHQNGRTLVSPWLVYWWYTLDTVECIAERLCVICASTASCLDLDLEQCFRPDRRVSFFCLVCVECQGGMVGVPELTDGRLLNKNLLPLRSIDTGNSNTGGIFLCLCCKLFTCRK